MSNDIRGSRYINFDCNTIKIDMLLKYWCKVTGNPNLPETQAAIGLRETIKKSNPAPSSFGINFACRIFYKDWILAKRT
jgi:hypothetical protein